MHKLTLITAFATSLLAGAFSVQAQDVEETILLDEYIISQEFIETEVLRVKPIARKLVVRGPKGKTREFSIPEGTRITVRGKEARLRDVRRGDLVLLAMKPNADGIIISRVRIPNANSSLEDRQANPVDQSTPDALPKTASSWYSILGLGFLALFAASLLGIRRRNS